MSRRKHNKPLDEDLRAIVEEKLRWLRLPGMAGSLPEILTQATEQNMTVLDVVSMLCDQEKDSRLRSAVKRRIQAAKFPEVNTVDGFDFDFCPKRKKLRARYLALHDLDFLASGINPLFIGAPGTGKTFLSRALAYKACTANRRVVTASATKMLNELHAADIHGNIQRVLRKYERAELLVIDDFAVLQMDAAQAKLAFQVISDRYEHHRSTAITTNRPFKEWTKVFPDALNAQIVAERLTDRAEVFDLLGARSYRINKS
jgi:DNA replication protein DnaC